MNVLTCPGYAPAPLRTLLVAMALLLGGPGTTPAWSRDDDHVRALQAVQAGQVLRADDVQGLAALAGVVRGRLRFGYKLACKHCLD